MAVTTLKPNINIKNLTAQQKSIKKEVKNVDVVSTKIKSSLFRRNKFKKESISRLKFLQNKRDQQTLRQEREDIIESSGISGTTRRVRNIVAESSRGFLGRILDFIGTLLVGWLLNNLPTILTMAKELIARIRRMFSLLTEFVQNLTSTFFNFGQLLGAVYKNVSSFDFFDTSGRVSDALTELQKNFDAMGAQFDEGVKLTTTSLGEGIESGEDAAPTGTDYTVPAGTSGTGTPEQQAMLKAIRFAEGTTKSYGVISGGDVVPELAEGKLTVKEVINMGNTSRLPSRFGGRKVNYKWSGATGAYQFMPDTLNGLVSSGVVGANELLTPQKQDELAIYLAKRRGVTDALLKKEGMSQKVSDLLAPEWASFPYSPKGGKSYYGQSYKPISQIKNVYESSLKSPPTPTTPGSNVTTSVVDEFKGKPGGASGIITSERGMRLSPTSGKYKMHHGIDIAPAGRGYYVALKLSGTVDYIGWDSGGYGNFVDIKSGNTIYRFAHLAKVMVKRGQPYKGQTIGEIGATGGVTGLHLHFEVRPGGGDSINPRPYLGLLSIGRQLTGIAGQQAAAPAPAQIAAQQPTAPSLATPAQIATQTPQRQQQLAQQVTPQRTGQQIVVIDEVQPSAPQMPMAAPSPQQPTIILLDPLNRMMKNKLLLDLAYT